MKRSFIALFLTVLAIDAFAVTPPALLNYQGVLRDELNAPQSGTFDMVFAFYQDTDPDCGDGALLLTDSHLAAGTGAVTVTGGLFNVALGSGAITAGFDSTLTEVFAGSPSVFLEVRIEGGGGVLETLCPRIRVVSAAYALNADTLDGFEPDIFLNVSASPQTKFGDLTVYGLTAAGNNINFSSPGAGISVAAGGLTLTGGDATTDDLLLKAGPSVLDGGMYIFGDGPLQLVSGGGPFQFLDSANIERANLNAGNLQLDGDLDVDGNNITFGDPGAGVSAAPGGLTLTGGDATTDDLLLRAGPSVLDGGIYIFGEGPFQLTSGGGTFQFIDSANVEMARLTTGNLQLDGDLEVDGNNITFGNPGASIAATASTFTVTGGDAASDDLILRASSTGTGDGQILINGGNTMILTSGNGAFSFVDGVTSTPRAGIDASGNLQIDGILDEDLAITIADNTIATVLGAGGNFTLTGAGLQFDIGDSFDDDVTIDGDLQCTGTKSFLQNHPYEKDLSIWYVALEGDEPGTYTRGSGRVLNGVATVPLGETFAWVTNPDIGLTAHVTPRGEWADLYVESVTPKEIVVRSRDASVPAAFDFIVYGLRIGYEDFPVVRKKTKESTVPSETEYARQYYVDRPELRALSPLARFQRMEVEAGVAHREPTASRALRQAIGEHNLEEVAGAAAAAPIAAADGPSRAQSSSDNTGGRPGLAADPSVVAGSLPMDATVDARSLRPSAEQLASLVEVAEQVEAGDVLVIDAERPGVMSLARTPADSAVFGVVAAEPGVVPGAVPPRETAQLAEDGEAAARVSVALSGIVLCKVDARFGPIRAGDLITTSSTPGHAMRAKDPRPGTIIGKALEPLGSGTALIKVLVMLH